MSVYLRLNNKQYDKWIDKKRDINMNDGDVR